MKGKGSTIILVLILLVGLSLLLYPAVSEYWNSLHQSRAIASYVERIAELDEEEYRRVLESAQDYNKNFVRESLWKLTDDEKIEYEKQLNIANNGIMGYIEIPSINCSLPIYHGTDENVLQVATGHLEGSSLPVGGESTHCVISGHRGLPSAKLFTNLDQLREGDLFMIYILDELYTYEVDQIRIQLPDDTTELSIKPGEDLCTLVTCTPYAVNSHRLLVRGHRVENTKLSDSRVVSDAIQLDDTMVAMIISVPILIGMLIWLLIYYRKR